MGMFSSEKSYSQIRLLSFLMRAFKSKTERAKSWTFSWGTKGITFPLTMCLSATFNFIGLVLHASLLYFTGIVSIVAVVYYFVSIVL